MRFRHLTLLLVGALFACQQHNELPQDAYVRNSSSACQTLGLTLSGDYPGARIGTCLVSADSTVQLVNSPEDEPINHSPWYGFRIDGDAQGQNVVIDIVYSLHQHRYIPKISTNGMDWVPLPPARISTSSDGKRVRLKLKVDTTPLWISAQENLATAYYDQWRSEVLASESKVSARTIGQSIEQRPIHLLESNPQSERVLIIVGRQHPPEITGALALEAFVERLYEHLGATCETEVHLCEFMRNTHVIVVPNLNPDGVARGHWRHGLGHIDLNRDWGPFTQPETQSIRDELDQLVARNKQLLLFLDFHSTARNLFYTQSEEEERSHGRFATRWLDTARQQGIYPFAQERRHNEGRPTSKNYMFARFGIPAITYEVGDETDRQAIYDSARVLADTMIATLQSRSGD